jgi:5-methylcytosine-specific restriction endonuclease McrA
MTLGESALRMTALLNRDPRHRKTRAYLATLPKRRKVVVTADDYPNVELTRAPFCVEPLRRALIARDAAGEEFARFVRKDRMRPRSKPREACEAPSAALSRLLTNWNCRPTGRQLRAWSSQRPRGIRTAEMTMRQRLMLYCAQEGLCGLCGDAMDGSAFSLSLDHVVPRSLCEIDGLGNLLLCHGECNGRKTNDLPTGCEMVWLIAVNCRLAVQPQRF